MADSVYVDKLRDTGIVVFRVGDKESRVSTIVIRGATDNYMDDIERAVDDGVNVFKGKEYLSDGTQIFLILNFAGLCIDSHMTAGGRSHGDRAGQWPGRCRPGRRRTPGSSSTASTSSPRRWRSSRGAGGELRGQAQEGDQQSCITTRRAGDTILFKARGYSYKC